MRPSSPSVHSTLVRVGARAWGVATGLVFGGGLFLATIALVVKGGPDVGAHLGRLGLLLPGYDVSIAGAFIGFVYAFMIGYALGRVLAPRKPVAINALPASRGKHVRLHGSSWGVTMGALLALLLFGTTAVLALRGGEHVGHALANLRVYFPGYQVTLGGGLIGAAYVFGVSYLLGRLIGAVYNRAVEVAER